MYEFHGWFVLAETSEEADAGGLSDAVAGLERLLASLNWPTAMACLRMLNGQPFLLMEGLVNRRRHEADDVDMLIQRVALLLPGSYGLLYERSDDVPSTDFTVRVMARGQITVRDDPFLSPTQPTIED
jgi:hypothetical protein